MDETQNPRFQQLLTERNALKSQNEQLWKIIEKQRVIIQQLQKVSEKRPSSRTSKLLNGDLVSPVVSGKELPVTPGGQASPSEAAPSPSPSLTPAHRPSQNRSPGSSTQRSGSPASESPASNLPSRPSHSTPASVLRESSPLLQSTRASIASPPRIPARKRPSIRSPERQPPNP
ncbi:hypothetical protein BJ085DRAFT_38322 [Dimargaris cristalligena]|uniref:Uncharacterized protein n=1 Tax=Dimargaris cristalligena TaxID=215637 RepID=A0A4Q0A2N8_9FUNG|nr:hypothetical protein BJ085DRAFT_38322 [Dimargaris cristalligena]|eukprot:RKP39450.1 hypothetical protein BJ085DRAFT_38322 [Dimargaris cristalligena]